MLDEQILTIGTKCEIALVQKVQTVSRKCVAATALSVAEKLH